MSENEKKFAIVMRMAGIRPENLIGYELHRQRRGGDLGHVDDARSHLNRRLIGPENWADLALAEIAEMRLENFANELESLERRRRKTEMERRFAEGPRDPWVASRHGPMREVILTANCAWFEAAGEDSEARFEERAIAWLTEHFGEDCVHARADLDEEAYHIHAVIIPRAKTKDGRRMLQPSKHRMIRSYEDAQDSVGAWFAELGLVRGEKRAEAIRDATLRNARIREDAAAGVPDVLLQTEVDVPKRRQHVSPRNWRERQEVELAGRDEKLVVRETKVAQGLQALQARDEAVTAREQNSQTREATLASKEAKVSVREDQADTKYRTAEAMISVAKAVAAGDIEVTEHPDPAGKTSSDPAEQERFRAARLFGKALKALRLKARDDAMVKARQEAQAELSAAYAEIKAADDAIVAIAGRLSVDLRAQIAQARKVLTARIMALGEMAKRQFQNRDRERPEK